MVALARQNALFVAEDWRRIYEAIQHVDFRAVDMENLNDAIFSYLSVNYPEEYNDWIASSEFVMKVDILTWLSQNILYRTDLNSRENLLSTAERRDSLIRLAQNIAYKVNRVRSAYGELKISMIRTDQPLFDSDGVSLRDRNIVWNDPKNENWFEQFVTIFNAVSTTRTQFGRPLASSSQQGTRAEQYVWNSVMPNTGSYAFNASMNGLSVPFEMFNANLDSEGLYEEIGPGVTRVMNVFYKNDGKGFGSPGTGFFMPIKQGALLSQDQEFSDPVVNRTIVLDANNVNNEDIFIHEIDEDGNPIDGGEWTKVDTVFGEGVSFTPDTAELRKVYEVDTLSGDRVRIRFGDGSFGRIPTGRFRFWVRTAAPNPVVIKPSAIREETLTFPYAANQQLYFLRVTFSLQSTIDNGAPTETNADIRTRANKVFYTQNRMVTGADYNSFFLKDNAIRKIKTVNRTYAGHSRYTKLHDPTGLYENVRQLGNDGRLYQKDTYNVQLVSADTTRLTNKGLIDQYLKPILRREDKKGLYYGRYSELYIEGFDVYRWKKNATVGTQSNGNVTRNNVVIPVGVASTDPVIKYLQTDSVFRYDSLTGPLAHVSRIIEQGDAAGGVILGSDIPDAVKIISVFAPFRDRLTKEEEAAINRRFDFHSDFAIRWDQTDLSWMIINYNDIDVNGIFDLAHAGDATGSYKDASWMVRFRFVPGGGSEDKWEIVDRGIGIFFESAEDVDFHYNQNQIILDPDTGELVRDTVRILESNEARDSLRRRGLRTVGTGRCDDYVFTFRGDGTTTCFKTNQTPLDPNKIVVLVNGIIYGYLTAYTITRSVFGDSICFYSPIADGLEVQIRVSDRYAEAKKSVKEFVADGLTTDYDLGENSVISNNVLAFMDGVLQNASLDFGIGTTLSNTSSLVFNNIIGSGVRIIAHVLSGINSPIFTKMNALGDGTTTSFIVPTRKQNKDTLFVVIDGAFQQYDSYTMSEITAGTQITFTDAPAPGVRIVFWSITSPDFARSKHFKFGGDGTTTSFSLGSLANISTALIIVSVDGVCQIGPYASSGVVWTTSGNNIIFGTPPHAGAKISVFILLSAVGEVPTSLDLEFDSTPDNLGSTQPYKSSSCMVSYIGQDVDMWVEDVLRHDDGYENSNGVQVKPADLDKDGFYDNPFQFHDLVIEDGYTDIVLWRQIVESGKDVWQPINQLTPVKGTYGYSNSGKPGVNSATADTVNDGDIHYDQYTDKWLVANKIDQIWELAPNQALFRKAIGRDHLRFMWLHYSPENHRIDPSPGNIHDVYMLTSGYDDAYRLWIDNGGIADDQPIPPTPESLRIQFGGFNDYKMMSDSLIYHSATYKPLFGPQAVAELQGTFKVIQTPGSSLSENDLRLRVLNVIDQYFDVGRWDFGEKFYFSELAAYIHAQMAPHVQTVVIVPKNQNFAFGELFEVRSSPDELFISTAGPDDVELITSLTAAELRIGVYSGT